MVLNNTNKNNSILLEVFASVFTVSSYFTDNPRTMLPPPPSPRDTQLPFDIIK